MNRRKFLGVAAALPLSAHAAWIPAGKIGKATAIDDASSTTEPLMDRYHLTLERILHGTGPKYTTEFLLEDIHGKKGRRFTNFSGDVSGRWIGALSTASAMYRVSFPMLDSVVSQVIALQHQEGYFGGGFHFDAPDDNDMALLWGNGRLLVGLMEYYEFAKRKDVLLSACKLGDFLDRIGPQFNSSQMATDFDAAHFATSYICWTQQIEGLARLYKATGDAKYLNLGAAISGRMERRPGDHVHGYLCSLRGTLELYEITGNKLFLARVETAWGDITHSGDLLITGGVPEAWSPKKLRTEGCAECDWTRLNLSLWKVTGEGKYLDAAEKAIFNELAMNQFSTGDFGHAVLNENGTPETVMVRAWWCCTFHGLRVFPDIGRSVFRQKGSEVFYDLPLDGKIESPGFSARAESRLARDGSIRLLIANNSSNCSLTMRHPHWAQDVSIEVNGKRAEPSCLANLKAADVIMVKYRMKLSQSVTDGSDGSIGRLSVHYGPWLLGVSSANNREYFNELEASNALLHVTSKPNIEEVPSLFGVPIAAAVADYVPAEFPEQPAQAEFRAVAEQTSTRSSRWQMTFAPMSGL